jgi:hypothetical protein
MTSTYLSLASFSHIDRDLPTERELADWRRRRDAARPRRSAIRLPRLRRHPRLLALRSTS